VIQAMLNALTVDLEDWYQGLTSTSRHLERWPSYEDRVVESTQKLLALLDRAAVRATFFVLGYVADEFPGLVRSVAEAGHEIALHGYHHRLISHLTRDELRADLLRGRAAVESASGQQVTGFRAPMFSINRATLWALELLLEMGFRYDSSLFPTRNMLYGFPGAPRFPYRPFVALGDLDRATISGNAESGAGPHPWEFVEFPPSTVRLFGINWPVAGGFYTRLLPYPLLRSALRRLNREGHPAILYVHPWEFDPDQPRPHPTPRERLTHYSNLHLTESKWSALLRDFCFAPLRDLDPPGDP
jgi:polysaccharide deacetylase family protein (PEP-CTERM system associated)